MAQCPPVYPALHSQLLHLWGSCFLGKKVRVILFLPIAANKHTFKIEYVQLSQVWRSHIQDSAIASGIHSNQHCDGLCCIVTDDGSINCPTIWHVIFGTDTWKNFTILWYMSIFQGFSDSNPTSPVLYIMY